LSRESRCQHNAQYAAQVAAVACATASGTYNQGFSAMIVPMRKATIVMLASDQDAVLRTLQSLGVLHVRLVEKPATHTAADVAEQMRKSITAHTILSDITQASDAVPAANDARDIVAQTLALHDQRAALRERIAAVTTTIEDLRPWGNFDPASIAALFDRGIYVVRCKLPLASTPVVPPTCIIQEIYRDNVVRGCVLISRQPLELDFPVERMPAMSLVEYEHERQRLHTELASIDARLAALARGSAAITMLLQSQDDDYALATARDQLSGVAAFVYLQGYCPVTRVNDLEDAARQHGWGLILNDPEPGELAPTLLTNPRWLQPIETVFEFIGTFPGYDERDISGVFFLFFALFYAMLIGDTGYGFLYLLLLTLAHWRLGAKIPRRTLQLLYTLNIGVIVWGVLTGSYFGITLPATSVLSRVAIINTSDHAFMMNVCFVIAAIHLTIAHAWNALRMLNSLRCLAEIGRLMITWGAFFLVRTLILGVPFPAVMQWIGAGGVLLTLVFSGALTNVADLFQFPFSVVNFFGDTASYLRLFAVGFASVALARAFNTLASNIGFKGIVAGALAVFILIAGHCLNLVLGPLSVLVHGLRLNLLEFSSHLGQEWYGSRYNPLRRRAPVADNGGGLEGPQLS